MAQTTGKTPKKVKLVKAWKNRQAGAELDVTPRIYRDLVLIGACPKGGGMPAAKKKTAAKTKSVDEAPKDKMVKKAEKTK